MLRKLNKKLTVFILLCSFISCISAILSVKLKPAKRETRSLLTNFLQKQANITLSNTKNIQYTGKISIGSKNQPFNLIFDTASPWLWVLPSSQDSPSKSWFNCSDSTSCRYQKQASGHYDIGTYWMFANNQNVQGDIVWDNIALDDHQGCFNQSFLVLQNDYTNLIGGDAVDGICGLSPKNDKNLSTIMDQLFSSGQIQQKMFSLYLDDNIEAYEDDSSAILFGGVDSSYYTGNFLKVRAIDSYYWQTYLNSTYLSLGSNSITVKIKAVQALIDSGSDIIKMTPSDFGAFTDNLKDQFGMSCSRDINRDYACTCPGGDISGYPNITLILDSQVFTLTPNMYLTVKSDSCVLLLDGCLTSSSNMPSDRLQTINTANYIILGSPFLRAYYTVFSVDDMSMSFATAIHQQKSIISSLEIIYMAFGIFIMVMFAALVFCVLKVCTFKNKTSKKDNRIFDTITAADRTSIDAPYYLASAKLKDIDE